MRQIHCCSAGFSLARDYQLGTRVFLVSRLGNATYQISKYLSVFLATMIIFTVPFLLEIILNCILFPMSAAGNLSMYDGAYRNAVDKYLMKDFYLYSPYLYAVIGTLFFGAVSGLFGVFTAADEMMTLQLAACIGMIAGCFWLFGIKLEDFTKDIFKGILGKPKNMQDAIMEETKTKKLLT